MIILLYGEDTFRSRQKLDKMIARFRKERDQKGLNTARLDAQNSKQGEIEEQIFASPFLSERRMVIIENLICSDLTELKEKLLKKIKSQQIPDSTILVFWERVSSGDSDLDETLLKRLKEEKYSQEFEKLEGGELKTWVSQKVNNMGAEITPEATDYLVRHIGNDLWQLNNTLEQASAYREEKEISTEEVKLFVKEDVDDDIFNLIDAIVEKDPQEVYNMIREQYRSGKKPGYVFGMILRQFRIMYELKDALKEGVKVKGEEFKKTTGLHPYVIKKTVPTAKKYSLEKMNGIYRELIRIDQKRKTGQAELPLLIDIFVGELCKI